MKIYLAASLNDRVQILKRKKLLEEKGHSVTSTWLIDLPMNVSALQDYNDILSSDLIIVFTNIQTTEGGFWVEMGIALGAGKRTMVIGRRRNLFNRLCEEYKDWQSAFREI